MLLAFALFEYLLVAQKLQTRIRKLEVIVIFRQKLIIQLLVEVWIVLDIFQSENGLRAQFVDGFDQFYRNCLSIGVKCLLFSLEVV